MRVLVQVRVCMRVRARVRVCVCVRVRVRAHARVRGMCMCVYVCLSHTCVYVCAVSAHINSLPNALSRADFTKKFPLEQKRLTYSCSHQFAFRDSRVYSATPLPHSHRRHGFVVLQCVLQCVAVCCSVLQCVAVCCGVLQCVAVCCSELQCVAVCCSVFSDPTAPLVLTDIQIGPKLP